MEKLDLLYIAPNGKLYKETKLFWRATHEVQGISITELFRDSYELNMELGTEVLFPVDFNCPFPVVEHAKDPRDYQGFIKGGGFRLNINYKI